jgi:microcystin-dependent protein
MSEPFYAEVRMMSFNFPPKGWALCNGQKLPVDQNQALFSLLGSTYGFDGHNFALPDLRGRVPIHRGSGFVMGQAGGEPAHVLTAVEMPQHIHPFNASLAPASSNTPAADLGLAASTGSPLYSAPADLVPMNAQAVLAAGGSQPHNNMQPCLTVSFCIALQGIFPSD